MTLYGFWAKCNRSFGISFFSEKKKKTVSAREFLSRSLLVRVALSSFSLFARFFVLFEGKSSPEHAPRVGRGRKHARARVESNAFALSNRRRFDGKKQCPVGDAHRLACFYACSSPRSRCSPPTQRGCRPLSALQLLSRPGGRCCGAETASRERSSAGFSAC